MIRLALRGPLLLATGFLCLSACGGGGGSTPSPSPSPPVAQTIAFATAGPIDKIVGDATFTNTASGGSGTGAISYSSSNTAAATVGAATGTVTVVAAGNTVITASKAASTGFLAATATYTLNVADPPPVAQTIAFANAGPIEKVFGDPPFTNAASGGAGTGAITYSSGDLAVATVDAATGQVTLVAPGDTTITADKAASAGFLAATVSYTLNVATPPPVAQTIAFANAGPITKTVGDAPFTNTASGGGGTGAITYSSGNLAVATVNATSGQVTIVAAGTAVITANKAASTGFLAATKNYTLNVDPAAVAQTITFATPGPIARTFGNTAFTNTASGGAGTGAITYSSGTLTVATVNATSGLVTIVGAGTAIITATKAASAGYQAATANYTLNVARASQTISFHYPGPLSKREYDLPITNPASGGGGNGAITYSSSDTGVALVDGATGYINFIAVGTATITANKAQSANHLAASATYVINIVSRPRQPMTAWIGQDDTLVQFPAGAVGAQFMRATQCGEANFDNCPLTAVSTLASTNVTDTQTSTFEIGVYALRRNGFTTRPTVIDGFGYRPVFDNEVIEENGTLWSLDFNQALVDRSNDGRSWMASSPPMPWGPRQGAAAVGFKNSIWVIGGNQLQANASDPGATLGEKADVFEFVIGGNETVWTTPTAAFGPRKYHRVANFNGRMWLIGGVRGAPEQYLNDIWSSTDGITWTRVTAAAPFAPRAEHALAVFSGRLWVIGGRNSAGSLDDVWSSFDGVDWQLESHFGNFGRYSHRAVANNSRLYVIGGHPDFNDYYVYSTVDGVTWDHHDSLGVPPYEMRSAAIAFRNRLWVFGGTNNENGACCARGDVWSSTDANTWQFESLGAPFSSMPGARMVAFNGELYLNASSSWERGQEQRLYKTTDVIDWVKAEPPNPIMVQANARSESALLTFNNRLWILGGRDLDPYTFHSVWGDVTSTADGSTWTWNNRNAFLPRYGHSGYVIGGRMFVLGGYNDLTEQMGDIHSTADGTVWREDVPVATNIGKRSYHETVVFNNRVWLLGGEKDGTGVTSEIWSSADGITWQLEKANEQATTRKQFGAVVWNGRIWVVGGKDLSGNLQSDVWSSADGVNWEMKNPSAIPVPRARMALAVFNNQLYLFGGESSAPNLDAGRGINEMWKSADGVTWRKLYRNEVEIP